MKPIRIENGILLYYGNRAGQVKDGRVVADPMFQGQEMDAFLKKQSSIREVKWMDGMFERLMAGGGLEETASLKNVRVWQLKTEVDVYMKFIAYDDMCKKFGPPNPEDYRKVYDGAVETNDLEVLYTKFNLEPPQGYEGHALSMSDVLELYDESGSAFYYVDRIGFQKIDFTGQEMSVSQVMQL